MGVPSKARLASAALLGAMLVAGFLAGLAWQGDAGADGGRAGQSEREGRPGREGRRLVIDELGLDAETQARVNEVVRHFRSRMRALDREMRADYEPRQRALALETRDSIKSLLSPAQHVVYDSLLAARYRRRGGGEGSGGSEADTENRRGAK